LVPAIANGSQLNADLPAMTTLFLMLSVAAGPLIVWLFQPKDRRKIRLLTTFSGAYVFSLTALHLMPEAFGGRSGGQHLHLPGVLILAGFFLQLLLDYFSHGIEHGHAHIHGEHGHMPWGVLLGLCIHAFVEGMPLGVGHEEMHHQHDHGDAGDDLHEHGLISEGARNSLILGIIMHNIPVSIVLMTLLLHQGIRMRSALWWMFVFASMSPLGMYLGGRVGSLAQYSRELMAIVVGIFLHISTTILFETGEEHRFNRLKALAIVLGAGLALSGIWLHPHLH
jgi:zinc and cadmium transporter